jgi:hypothetical protein
MKALKQLINRCGKLCLIALLGLLGENIFCQTNSSVMVSQTNAPQINIQIPRSFAITNVLSVKPEEETLKLLREATASHTLKEAGFLFLGAFISGLVGLVVSLYLHCKEVQQKEKEEQEFRDNILRAIRCELNVLGSIYDQNIGKQLKEHEDKKADFFGVALSLTQNWFTVFEGNAAHLGKIKSEISSRIIATYALNKGLIEAYRINNEYLKNFHLIESKLEFGQNNIYLQSLQRELKKNLIKQFDDIKMADKLLKISANDLHKILEEQGVKVSDDWTKPFLQMEQNPSKPTL